MKFSFAQTGFKQNYFYAEIGGNGIFGSINYERQVSKQPGLGVRVGLGFYMDAIFHYTVPVGINYLLKFKGEKSFIDFGAVGTWTTNEETSIGGNQKDKGEVYGNFMINFGYRRHTSNNLNWRLNLLAVKNKYSFGPWLGASIGKGF